MKDISLYEKVPPLKNKFQVKFFEEATQIGLLPHWHEHIELLYFTSGECDFFCDGKMSHVKAGDLIVVNSTEIHTFTSTKGTTGYICMITYPSFFEDVSFSDVIIKNHISGDSYIRDCIMNIREEKKSDSAGSDMMIKSHNYRLFAYLVRNYALDEPQRRTNASDSARLKRLDIVFQYIAKNYNDKINTSSLAKMCYLSEGYFCRFFKKATGRTVADYITEFRINKASIMLVNTDSTISDIALNTGFDDANYFSRVFKKTTGMSPSRYRNEITFKDGKN